MADASPALTSQDYDPWQRASPLQLLTLLHRLGVTSRVIARWCGVKPSHVSMWTHEKRSIPLRYAPILHLRARQTLEEAARLNAKEVAAQPTEALQRATQAELSNLWTKWKLEVLYDAGTLRKGLLQQYQALGRVLMQAHFTPADQALIAQMLETILAKVETLVTLQPDAPSPEEAWIARLTAAHEAAHPTQTAEEPDTPQRQTPQGCP
jgi:hypothetical protein